MPGHGGTFARTASRTDQTAATADRAWPDRTERATRRAAWARRHDGRQLHGDRTGTTGLVGAVLVFVAMLGAFDAPTVTPVEAQPVVTVTADAVAEAPAEMPAVALDAITVTAERL
jgi:hypothetical protein